MGNITWVISSDAFRPIAREQKYLMDYKIRFCSKLLRKFNLVFVVRSYGKTTFYVLHIYVLVPRGRRCSVLSRKTLSPYHKALRDMTKHSSEGGFSSFLRYIRQKRIKCWIFHHTKKYRQICQMLLTVAIVHSIDKTRQNEHY